MGVIPPRGLYALVDVDTLARHELDPVAFADAVLEAGPALVQLRAKHLGARETLALLRALAPRVRAKGALLFANDRVDLALAAGCDGVHVGQGDVPVRDVRAIAPRLLVGVSTHDEPQLAAAFGDAPDYVAFGPVFATSSKANAEPAVGLERLRAACIAPPCPIVAIGGLDAERVEQAARAGALAAVISALVPDDGDLAGVTARARDLVARALAGSRG